jgi:hypothetical protein
VQHVEARAEQVLAAVPPYVWDGRSLPVPVADIADSCFGLLVVDAEDTSLAPGAPALAPGQTLSGLLLAHRREIWVSAAEGREWPSRRRFTIGHELGHWCLHRDGEQHSIFCRAAAVAGALRPALPRAAAAATAFAAALLMPAALLRRCYERTGGDFMALCRIFGASQSAMGRRLHAVV